MLVFMTVFMAGFKKGTKFVFSKKRGEIFFLGDR